MPKIISGFLKGRNINGFDIEGTRPTMDRVKESVFAMIQDYIDNSTILDLFAGSGNLGIEAISNGAKIVYFNDFNKKCISVIKSSIEKFNIKEKSMLLNLDYQKALKYFMENNIKFDVIFLDPPYKDNIVIDILDKIIEYNLLNTNGVVIGEVTTDIMYDKLSLYKTRNFGEKKIFIWKNIIK